MATEKEKKSRSNMNTKKATTGDFFLVSEGKTIDRHGDIFSCIPGVR